MSPEIQLSNLEGSFLMILSSSEMYIQNTFMLARCLDQLGVVSKIHLIFHPCEVSHFEPLFYINISCFILVE
jgi:hypothetical protein